MVAVPYRGAGRPAATSTFAELAAVLGEVDRLRAGADHRNPGIGETLREPERGLPAELHDHPGNVPDSCSACTTSSTSSKVSGSKYSRSAVS